VTAGSRPVGFIGRGNMGGRIARRIVTGGHRVLVTGGAAARRTGHADADGRRSRRRGRAVDRHWHGAGADDYLPHLATSLGTTHWGRPVTDEEYVAVRPRTIPEEQR
jgi:hypothetical protein